MSPAAAFAQDTTTAGTAAATDRAGDQADAQTTSPEANEPGDIVVTAQKRSERLQDVPVAVSVISGDAIALKGGVNLERFGTEAAVMAAMLSGTVSRERIVLDEVSARAPDGFARIEDVMAPADLAAIGAQYAATAGFAHA